MTYKIISADEIVKTAADATALDDYNPSTGESDLDFGNLVFLQTKILKFRIGNTGAARATYAITITSDEADNSGLVTNTTISSDGLTYVAAATGITVILESNKISPVIYIKHYVDISTAKADRLGLGTVQIEVSES